jgi:hypothetical protein
MKSFLPSLLTLGLYVIESSLVISHELIDSPLMIGIELMELIYSSLMSRLMGFWGHVSLHVVNAISHSFLAL